MFFEGGGIMYSSVSPTTGENFYSGSFQDIAGILSVLNIGEGKMDKLTQPTVENYQEITDREIDGILGECYTVPLRGMNQVQPNGTTKRVFPGDVRRCAMYWTAGLLLLNEFQQLAQNVTDQASGYIEDSKRQIFALKRFTHRIRGQEYKSQISKFLPPSLQPAMLPEQDW